MLSISTTSNEKFETRKATVAFGRRDPVAPQKLRAPGSVKSKRF
jgi:hypothetical protein